jgi:predicted metal-dependent phosphoesterase TrpH
MYADLHTHSTFSDGTDTPAELLKIASDEGIKVLAISDHDTVEGVKAAMAAPRPDVRLIPAIEVSIVSRRRFVHILGYYIAPDSQALAGFIRGVSADKTENTRVNFETALSDGCFSYDWARVAALNPGQRRLSGVHVVNAMKRDGYEIPGMTVRQMFWKYFRPEGDRFTETEKATPQDAIDIIKAASGVPVIAHPKLVYDDEIVREIIRCGVMGIEAHHSLHTPEETRRYLQMAEEHGLLVTGGSDWHGKNSDPAIARMGMAGLPHGDFEILNMQG